MEIFETSILLTSGFATSQQNLKCDFTLLQTQVLFLTSQAMLARLVISRLTPDILYLTPTRVQTQPWNFLLHIAGGNRRSAHESCLVAQDGRLLHGCPPAAFHYCRPQCPSCTNDCPDWYARSQHTQATFCDLFLQASGTLPYLHLGLLHAGKLSYAG